MKKVTVQVPATSANLGSAFDCAGIAFRLYNVLSFEKKKSGVSFLGFEEKFANEDNLAYLGYKMACLAIGADPSVTITLERADVPVSRGLGSSSTLIVAGVVAANRLHGDPLPKKELLRICNDIEGHPDNIAPALLGGFCVSLVAEGIPVTAKYAVSDAVHFTAVYPDFEVQTKDARAVLPETVARADAIFNLSRTALMQHAFTQGHFFLLKHVTKDKLHEPYRKSLFRNIDEIEAAAYACGATSFIISGAGSACLCISEKPIDAALNVAIASLENNWQAKALSVDAEGALVLKETS